MKRFDFIMNASNKEIPRVIRNRVKCDNPKCATTTERYVSQILHLVDKENLEYRCEYCDHIMALNESF